MNGQTGFSRSRRRKQRPSLGHSAGHRESVHFLTNNNEARAPAGARDWYRDLLLSTLFRASIKLQTQMDRHFQRFGMSAQEAAVLVRCVEARQISPGALAHSMARDKGKVTRFLQRLTAKNLLKRAVRPQDRRVAVIRPTSRGRATAIQLRLAFDDIRNRFFDGLASEDLERVGSALTLMLANASRNIVGSPKKTLKPAGLAAKPMRSKGTRCAEAVFQ